MTIKAVLRRYLWPLSDRYLVAAGAAKMVGRKRSRIAGYRHFVIMTPSDVGNLGDDAMVTSTVLQLKKRCSDGRITLLTYEPEDADHYQDIGVDVVCIKEYFSRIPSMRSCAEIGEIYGQATDFILIGADNLDGKYSPSRSFRRLFLARQAQRAGLKTHIIGFSFSDKAIDSIKSYLKAECRDLHFMCRDPLSAKRITSIIGKSVENGADLAFNLPIPARPKFEAALRAEAQLDIWRAEGRKIVVFNANPIGLKVALPGIDLDDAAGHISDGLLRLIGDTGCAVLALTHDNRPAHSDAVFMQKIVDRLEPGLDIFFVPETVSAQDIKYLCQKVDLTVTGRMHLGIGSLGAGTATMVLDYQGKVRGLFDLFGLQDMALDVKDLIRPDIFAANVADRLSRHDEVASVVQSRLDDIHALSARNIDLVLAEAGEVG